MPSSVRSTSSFPQQKALLSVLSVVILNALVGSEEKADIAEQYTGRAYRSWKQLIGEYLPGLFSKCALQSLAFGSVLGLVSIGLDDHDKSRICKHHSGCKSYASVGFIKAIVSELF